jgi:hypothetical protein
MRKFSYNRKAVKKVPIDMNIANNIKAIIPWLLEMEQTNGDVSTLHMNPGGWLLLGALSKSRVQH